jgi:hypothetical protein
MVIPPSHLVVRIFATIVGLLIILDSMLAYALLFKETNYKFPWILFAKETNSILYK